MTNSLLARSTAAGASCCRRGGAPAAVRRQLCCSAAVPRRGRTLAVTPRCRAAADDSDDDRPSSSAAAAAAVAACCLLAASASPALAAPAEEMNTFGAERTRALIEQSGTPGAVRPDTMSTNVPFQAPGINAPPRGPSQEQGTSPKRILKDAGRQIRRNARDPDAAPFGVGKGPLVREGKKMKQPGNLKNINRAGADMFKQQSPEPAAVKAVKTNPDKQDKGGYFILFDKLLGKR